MATYAEIWPQFIGPGDNVVVPRPLIRLCGTIEMAAVLADLVWWQREKGEWFFRTDEAICEQQGVSRYAVARARQMFMERGWLKAERRGVPATMHYSLDMEALTQALLPVLRNQTTGSSESNNKSSGIAGLNTKGVSKGTTSPKPAAARTRPRDELFDAFVVAWGYDPAKPAGRIRGLAGDFAARCRRHGVIPSAEQFLSFHAEMKALRCKTGGCLWGSMVTLYNCTDRFLAWLDARPEGMAHLDERWWFYLDGSPLLKDPVLAVAELGLSCDPRKPSTWPEDMHAAYATRLFLVDGQEAFL